MTTTNNNQFWMSTTDLMSGLMIIFMFIAIAYMHEIREVNNGIIYITEGFQDKEKSLFNELNKEFKNDLEDWNAYIDSKTLSIIFKEPDVLFKKGEFKIKMRFKEILNDFFPRYIAVLKSEKYEKEILAIRIEGQTSKEWLKNTKRKEAYLKNMRLSQMRASEVLDYILEINLNNDYPWVRNKLQAVGYSSSKTKHLPNGKENKNLSRRVEFKVVTNTKEKLYSMINIINNGGSL